MSKTAKDRETYKKERQPRTKKRKIESEREREVEIPSRQSLGSWGYSDDKEDIGD